MSTMNTATPDEVMETGLKIMGFSHEKQAERSHGVNWDEFKSHFGSAPAVLAAQWHDLCTTNVLGAQLPVKDTGEKGLKLFLMAHYFLWTYPKNRFTLASRFGVCDKRASGASLWTWVSQIAALKENVIIWPENFKDPNGPQFVLSVDCREVKVSEKKHPTYNLDTSFASKKHGGHAGLKHELGVAIWSDQIVWVNGPFKPTRHDITVFREGLKAKMLTEAPGKFAICDKGYRTKEADEEMLAHPNSKDPLPLKKFKSLVRCRQEDMNARFAKFACMSNEFTHSVEKNKACFEAVAVTIQYQLNTGHAYLPNMKAR